MKNETHADWTSTHQGEEEALLDGFIKIKQELDNPLLILVPRHPERFGRVKQIIRSYNLSISVRSIKEEVQNDTDVLWATLWEN